MKHCFKRLLLGSSFVLLTLSTALRADIVVMKDGTRYEEAQIISETPESVTFSYVFKKKFPDKRTEPRSAIAEIIKQKPEATEVLPLLKLVPSADLLTADKYESLIQDTLRPFITKYPGTPEAKQVEDIIKTLQAEKEKVVGGSIKVEGEWISTEQAKRDAHSIEAYRVRRDIKNLAAEGKIREALNEWSTKMISTDNGFTDTLQYVKTVPEVLAILDTYKKQLEGMIAAQPELDKRRKDGLTKMIDSDPIKTRTKNAIEAEEKAYKTEVDLQKKTHAPWISIYKYDKKSLDDAAKAVVNEATRLRALDLAKITAQNEALQSANNFIVAENLQEAEAALKRANAITGVRPPTKTMQALSKAITDLKKVQSDKLKAKKIAGGGNGAALTNGGSTATDSHVAEALAKVSKERAEKKEAKDAKGSDDDGEKTPKKGSSTTKTDTKKKSHAVTESAPPADEGGGLQKYLVFGGGGLLAVLLAVIFMQKKKNG